MSELTDKQVRLNSLYKIRDSGVSGLRSGEDRVEYRSFNDVLLAISALEGEIADIQGTISTRGPRYIYQSGKGL